MKKISTAVIALALLASCKKDKDGNLAAPPATKKLVEISNVANATDKTTYHYDATGRLSESETPTSTWKIEYLSGKVIVTFRSKSPDELLGVSEYTVDQAGRATSLLVKNAQNVISYTQTFGYDANGYMVNNKIVWADGQVNENYYTIVNGNAVKQDFYTNGTLSDHTDYEYDLTIPSKSYFTMMSTWPFENLFGKGYTNVSSAFKRYNNSGTMVFQRQTSFVTDAAGYVTSKTDTYPLAGITKTYQLKYE